jgi:hypothetical protein
MVSGGVGLSCVMLARVRHGVQREYSISLRIVFHDQHAGKRLKKRKHEAKQSRFTCIAIYVQASHAIM